MLPRGTPTQKDANDPELPSVHGFQDQAHHLEDAVDLAAVHQESDAHRRERASG
jgi:hypothetical protein